MRKTSLIFYLLALLTFFTVGCSEKPQSTSNNGEKVAVYTTIYPLEDFAKKIGGDHVDVTSIYPLGADAHTYEPTQSTIVKIAVADLFVYNGAELEAFAEKLNETLANEKVKIVDSSSGLELIESDHAHDHDAHADEEDHNHNHDDHANHELDNHGETDVNHEHEHDDHGEGEAHEEHEHHHNVDPHIWLDPILAIHQAEVIKNALIEIKPEAKDEFENNFQKVKEQLEEIDQQFKDVVQQAESKKILVSHAAYGYWEKRYGIEQISATGLSPTDEPSPKALTEVIATAKEHELKYILFETFATPKIAEIVKNEVGAEILRMYHLASLSDEDIKNNKDYFDLMKENIETLRQALNK